MLLRAGFLPLLIFMFMVMPLPSCCLIQPLQLVYLILCSFFFFGKIIFQVYGTKISIFFIQKSKKLSSLPTFSNPINYISYHILLMVHLIRRPHICINYILLLQYADCKTFKKVLVPFNYQGLPDEILIIQ